IKNEVSNSTGGARRTRRILLAGLQPSPAGLREKSFAAILGKERIELRRGVVIRLRPLSKDAADNISVRFARPFRLAQQAKRLRVHADGFKFHAARTHEKHTKSTTRRQPGSRSRATPLLFPTVQRNEACDESEEDRVAKG